jgi:AAA15 family ATPase/GTPase
MIKSIRLENVRGLNIELKEFTQVNVLTGEMGSGKTTILEELIFYNRYKGIAIDTDYSGLQHEKIILKRDNAFLIDSFLVQSLDFCVSEDSQIDKIISLLHPRLDLTKDLHSFAIMKMRRIINCLLSFKDGGVLAIDDIEVFWHNSVFEPYLKWILQTAKEKNVQLFIATHSLDIISIISKLELDPNNLTIFRLDRKPTQQILTGDLGKSLIFGGYDIR